MSVLALPPSPGPGDDDDHDAEVVQFVKAGWPEPVPPPPSWAQGFVERYSRSLPTKAHLKARWRWFRGAGLPAIAWWLVSLPWVAIRELRPIWRGLGRIVLAWARWVSCAKQEERVKAAEGKDQAKEGRPVEKSKAGRGWISLAVGLLFVGVYIWLHIAGYGGWLLFGFILVCDAVGRAGREGVPKLAPALPAGPIEAGTPLSTLRAEVEQVMLEQTGQDEDGVVIEMPRPTEHGWSMRYYARVAITDDHQRGLERALQIRHGAVSLIVDRDTNTARGELRVALVDPLVDIVPAPEPGELTIFRPLPLGVTASGEVWAEPFLRVHFCFIGASQSGKSSCFWQAIDVLRRCPEVEIDGIDLTEGPAFGAPRRAFRRRAFTEETAMEVLQEAVALSKRRNAELNRMAEADDTDDEFEEKHRPTPEEPQRYILIDEFARLAEFPELLKLVEYLLRYGAKGAVVVGIAGQGSTLQDFGTSVVRGQVMLKVMFACGKNDVLWLFGKDARDKGFRPDLFEAASGDHVLDAGKCFAMSTASRTPEPRRAYRLTQGEVRRRDRERGRRQAAEPQVVDAVEIPEHLDRLRQAFESNDNPDLLSTAAALEFFGDDWSAKALAEALKEWVRPGQHTRTKVRGYWRADMDKAIRGLG